MTAMEHAWFDTTVGIAHALNSIVLLVLVIVLVPAVISLIKTLKKVRTLLDTAHDDLKPFFENANKISGNVHEISESVRDEVRQVKSTVEQATKGIQTAVESTERRVRDFGALIDVAQKEAERAVVSTAAAVEGVRAGAKAMRDDDIDDDEPLLPNDRKSGGRPRVRSNRKRSR